MMSFDPDRFPTLTPQEVADIIVGMIRGREDRSRIWDLIREEVCHECGGLKNGRKCYCTWDE